MIDDAAAEVIPANQNAVLHRAHAGNRYAASFLNTSYADIFLAKFQRTRTTLFDHDGYDCTLELVVLAPYIVVVAMFIIFEFGVCQYSIPGSYTIMIKQYNHKHCRSIVARRLTLQSPINSPNWNLNLI